MSNIVGIDLGTTFSSLAMLNAIGKPEIVPNADGERLTPSALYFDEENVIRVGVEALNSRHLNPGRSVRWVKRHMGDPDYKVSIDGKDWTATELSALILKKLRQDSAAQIGEIRDAVISVPAHFDEIRRKATMDAGTAAGFNVIGIVNEPVSAALCYATSRDVSGRVLVYDLGGGTFDVTLMNVKGLEMEIICSQGDHALGGMDFDKKVLEILDKMYKDKFSTELIKRGGPGQAKMRRRTSRRRSPAGPWPKRCSTAPAAACGWRSPGRCSKGPSRRWCPGRTCWWRWPSKRPGSSPRTSIPSCWSAEARACLWCGPISSRSSVFRPSARSMWMSVWRWAPRCTRAWP
jgi:hypothetical protein